MDEKKVHLVTALLVWVGALNWGLVGLLKFNLVNTLLGGMPMVEQLVYVLVGAAAVYEVATHQKRCKDCASMMK